MKLGFTKGGSPSNGAPTGSTSINSLSCASVLNIGTGYSSEASWVYEVDPVPPIELDPERNGHLSTSRICLRALVIGCLHRPAAS